MERRGTVSRSRLEARTATDAMLVIVFHELNGSLSVGEIQNAHIPEKVSFFGYGDMLLKMERIYELMKIPQPLNEMRRLGDGRQWEDKHLKSTAGWNMKSGNWIAFQADGAERLSLAVQVLYRQHNSWQGFINIKGRKIFYRSALELLLLIDDCVRENGIKK